MRMRPLRIIGAATLTAVLLSGSAAAALTADSVWSAVQSRATALGAKLTAGSQSKSGGKLMMKDVTATSTQTGGTVTFTLPEIDLTESGDGSVTMSFAPKATIDFKAMTQKGGQAEGVLQLAQSGLKTVVSGTEADMTYTTNADSFALSLASLKVDGKDVGAGGTMTIDGFASTAHLTGTDPQVIDSTSSAKSLKLAFDGKDPAGKGSGHFEAMVAGLQGTGHVAIPKGGITQGDLAASLAAGYEVKSSATYGQTTFAADMTDPTGHGTLNGSVSSGRISVEMDKGHLQYGGGNKDVQITIKSDNMPLPQIHLTEAESDFNFLLPVTKSDTPQNFALLLKVIGLDVNKEVWGMVDPTGALPHDPATLIVDLSGQGQLGFNLFDPTLAGHPPMDPGKLKALKVNQLQLTVAGADLTGTGDLTFDNAGPIPKPVGSVDLKLTGGNGLLDKLTQMGLVPQDQAAGLKMMLGMFAKPAGNDVMTSKIEFKDDGSILANGQRIQ